MGNRASLQSTPQTTVVLNAHTMLNCYLRSRGIQVAWMQYKHGRRNFCVKLRIQGQVYKGKYRAPDTHCSDEVGFGWATENACAAACIAMNLEWTKDENGQRKELVL